MSKSYSKSDLLESIHITIDDNESNDLLNSNENIDNIISRKEKKVIEIVHNNHKEISPMMIIEKNIYNKFNKYYSNHYNNYNIKIITEIISNSPSHIVAIFKDYLIEGDYSEFLQKKYSINESNRCLPKIFEYYYSSSVIFPNYVVLPESKYLYKNIQRKQRIIDNQQNNIKKKDNQNKGNVQFFTIQVLDSILDQTDTSGIKDFFGVKNNQDNSEENITVDNIINKISNAENKNKLLNERKILNTTLKKINDVNKKKEFNLNLNAKVKGRNYKNYVDGGFNTLNNKNKEKKYYNYSKLNVNSTTSNGMKNTKVSSTTIDVESKNNINNQLNNNTINVNYKKNKNKNLINSVRRPKIIQSLFTNNNIKESIIKISKESSRQKPLYLLNNKKSKGRNVKSFSPINQSSFTKNKFKNIKRNNNNIKLSSSSSLSTNKQISSYNSKKALTNQRMEKMLKKIYHKNTFSYNGNSKEKNDIISKPSSKLKDNSIPCSERGFLNKNYHQNGIILSKMKKKNYQSNKKNSISVNVNKKNLSILIKKKEIKENLKKNKIKNIKNTYRSPDCKVKYKNLNFLILNSDNNNLQSIKSFHTINNISINEHKKKNKKNINSLIFPSNNNNKNKMNNIIECNYNSNSISRNTSNSERIIFNDTLINKLCITNRNNNNIQFKTLELKKRINKK